MLLELGYSNFLSHCVDSTEFLIDQFHCALVKLHLLRYCVGLFVRSLYDYHLLLNSLFELLDLVFVPFRTVRAIAELLLGGLKCLLCRLLSLLRTVLVVDSLLLLLKRLGEHL